MSDHDSRFKNLPNKVVFPSAPPQNSNEDMDMAPLTAPIPTDMANKFLIPGQGCLVFSLKEKDAKSVQLLFKTIPGEDSEGEKLKDYEVRILINQAGAHFNYREKDTTEWEDFILLNNGDDPAEIYPKDGYKPAIDENPECLYWVSVDNINKRLRYGKGETRYSTRLIDYLYDKPKDLFSKKEARRYDFIERLQDFEYPEDIVKPEILYKDPIAVEPPVNVVSSKEFTMNMAAAGSATTPASLSKECQILYGNVADFELNTPDFPDFEQAIEYSMRTPGKTGYEILKFKLDNNSFDTGGEEETKKKGTDSEEEYKEVYLRITLGQSQGESPGIPYVMEIWPSGCASPVHNHGSTHAIIKVLRGKINVDLYRMLPGDTNSGEPLKGVQFKPGDVTYIMPNVNQFHLLKNLHEHTDTCITIQCYSYGQDADYHHGAFDYIENHKLGHFDPISDYDFLDFKAAVKAEWEEYLADKFWMTYEPEKKEDA